MDVTALAQSLVTILAPLLPYLLKAGEKAAEEVGKEIGGEVWEKAKSLWSTLLSDAENRIDIEKAAGDLTAALDDEDARAALRWQLRKALEQNPALADELARLLQGIKLPSSITFIEQKAGDNAIQIGQAGTAHIER